MRPEDVIRKRMLKLNEKLADQYRQWTHDGVIRDKAIVRTLKWVLNEPSQSRASKKDKCTCTVKIQDNPELFAMDLDCPIHSSDKLREMRKDSQNCEEVKDDA